MCLSLWMCACLAAGFGAILSAQIPAPPGRMVDIGGSRLHLSCSGTGSPAIILEAGFPGSSLDWVLVQPEVAKFTKVCSYDRAGFGWSDAGKAPRSSAQIAEDLRQLLANAEIAPPYVLVGHSMGGLYVRAFVGRYPKTVAGMVLVDATHEDQWDVEPSLFWEQTASTAIRLPAPNVDRPANISGILKEMWATERWKTGERLEREAIRLTIAEAQKEPKRLPVIPLAVVSAGPEIGWLDGAPRGALKGQQLQRELAALSPLGRWIPVAGANHYVHLSQPAAVIDAIRQVAQAVRSMRPAAPANRSSNDQ